MKKSVSALFILVLTIGNVVCQTRVWNMERLNKAKSENSVAFNQILKDADKLLPKTISSVMDKNKPAPSGDKHNYISCGPYWWPDPKNPTGPYIRKDGVTNRSVTTPDKKNLGTMANSIIQLSLAYYLSGDEKYASKAVQNLRVWFLNPETRMNPNLNYGQTIYGHLGGKGRGAGLIETYRFVELLDGVELLKKSPYYAKPDQQGLINWFSEYLNWMMTSEVGNQEYNANNNHGTAFDVQATRIALFVGKVDIARKYINNFTERRLFTQIEPDGKQPLELARTKGLHYSTFNLSHMLDMCCIAKTMNINLYGVKSTDGRSISKALDYLSQFAGKPQSQFPYKQIVDWDDTQEKLCFQLYRADQFNSRPMYVMYYKPRQNDWVKKYFSLLL